MEGSVVLLATTISSGVLLGFLPALLVRFRAQLSQPLGVPESTLDGVGVGALILTIPLLLACGSAVDRWGAQEILFAGILLAAMGMAALGLCQSLKALIAVAMILALAGSCITTACPMLMPRAFLGDEEAAASLNLGYIPVGLGFLLLPHAAELLRRRFGLRQCMLVLALFCFVPALLTVLTPRADYPIPRPAPDNFLADPKLWLAGLVVLCYFPLEGVLDSWMTGFLANIGYSERQSFWRIFGFWLFFLAARLATGWWLVPGWEVWWILVLVLVSAITLGNLSGAYGVVKGWGLSLMGACYGPILPTLLGVVMGLFPETPAGAVGAIYALGITSNLFVKPAVAAFSKSHSVRATILVPLVLAMIMAVPTLVLALVR